MYPFIGIGDWIYIESIRPDKLKRGMLAVFFRRNDFVVHRILKIDARNGCLIEKGDRLPETGRVDFGDVIGKVTRIRKGQSVYELETGRMRLINMAATLRSCAHLFWAMYFQDMKTRFSESLPDVVRAPLHTAAAFLRRITGNERPFQEAAWHQRIERILIGNQAMPVSVAPENRDMGQVVRVMREEKLDAVLCLFSDGITETLLRYFPTIEYIVILFDRKGCLVACIEHAMPRHRIDRTAVKYTLIVSDGLFKGMELSAKNALRIEGIL
jgi:hypothetical protein